MVWMKLTNGESTANLSPLAAETLKPAFDRILASVATQINHRSFCRDSGYVGSLIVRCANSPLAIAVSKTFFRNGMGRKYWFSFFASSALEYVFCRSILFLGIFFVLSFGPSALCNLRVWSSHFSIFKTVACIGTVVPVPKMAKSIQTACTRWPVFLENRNLGVFLGFRLVLRASSKACHCRSVGSKVTSYMSGPGPADMRFIWGGHSATTPLKIRRRKSRFIHLKTILQ